LRFLKDDYQAVFENASIGIAVVDLQGRLVRWNKFAEELLGLDHAELYLKPVRQLFALDEWNRLESEISKGTVEDFETRLNTGRKTLDIGVSRSVISGKQESGDKHIYFFRDISQRKKLSREIEDNLADLNLAQSALKENETFLTGVLESSPTPILVTNLDFSIRYINPALENLTGYTNLELLGRKMPHPWWPPESTFQYTSENLELHLGDKNRIERQYRKKNGEKFWVTVTVNKVSEKGEVKYYIANWVDITERKNIAAELRRNQRLLTLGAKLASLGPWEFDVKNNCFIYNDEFYALYSTSVEREGPTMSSEQYLRELVYQDDRQLVLTNSPRFSSLPPGEHFTRIEHRIKRRDGEVRFVEVLSKITINDRGELVEWYGAKQDITRSKQAEEALRNSESRFRGLVENSPLGISLSDLDGNFLGFNKAMLDLFGYQAADEFQNSALALYADKEDRKTLLLKLQEQGTVRDFEIRMKRKDGELIWCSINSIYQTSEDGGKIIISTIENITRRKEMETYLRALSTLDGLTGIANRRKFDEAVSYEWQRARRSHHPLSLIMMDIDFFKAFNDHYGHIAGDECLRRLAGAINQICRTPPDLFARYGGEEFVMLLPETDSGGAVRVAERIQTAIESLGIPHAYSSVSPRVTLSMGVATMTGGADISALDLIHMADELLFKAKSGGRNQFMVQDRMKV